MGKKGHNYINYDKCNQGHKKNDMKNKVGANIKAQQSRDCQSGKQLSRSLQFKKPLKLHTLYLD